MMCCMTKGPFSIWPIFVVVFSGPVPETREFLKMVYLFFHNLKIGKNVMKNRLGVYSKNSGKSPELDFPMWEENTPLLCHSCQYHFFQGEFKITWLHVQWHRPLETMASFFKTKYSSQSRTLQEVLAQIPAVDMWLTPITAKECFLFFHA